MFRCQCAVRYNDLLWAHCTWPRVVTLKEQDVSPAIYMTTPRVNLLKHVQPGAHYIRPLSDLVQQRSVQNCLHRRLLNLTGFFSSFAGAEAAAGVAAMTLELYDYDPDQGRSGASLLK